MFELSEISINEIPEEILKKVHTDEVGGIVFFQGVVRNHNNGLAVSSLEYSSYPEMAVKIGNEIVDQAKNKFDIVDAYCIHRTGHLQIKDTAVWVVVTSHHRKEAFVACEFIINTVKLEVPIWKKEHYLDQTPQWVACHRCGEHKHE